MSEAIPETAASDGKEPRKPWQYITIIALVVIALLALYFILHHVDFWGGGHVKQPDRSLAGSNGALPYRGPPPEAREIALHTPVVVPRPASSAPSQAPSINEQDAFDAPIMDRVAPPPRQQTLPPHAQPAQVEGRPSGSLLLPTAFAYRVPHPLYTIRKGTLIPCTQVTAIDTGAGGNILVKATLPSDVWGMRDPESGGRMVLLDKGTEIVGEVGHALVNGLSRLGVVWREATTPWGVGIELDSPAVGPLGEGGLNGDVNRHEWQKIKGVLMFSLLQGALNIGQAAAQAGGSTNINLGSLTSGADQAGNILLQSQIQIPDTLHRDHGLACGIFTARDVDFSKVYSAGLVP